MSGASNIRPGMEVYGSDNQLVGTVEGLQANGLQVGGMLIPVDAVARVAQNRVFLRGAGAQFMSRTVQTGTSTTGMTAATGGVQSTEGEIVVPVAEERLSVAKQQTELGEVQIRKEVIQEQVSVPVELMREEVHVEQRDIPDRPLSSADAERLFEGGTIRVPVRGEEAVVQKEAIVTGEVVVERERLIERQEITETVRREQVEVDEHYHQHRGAFQQHFTQRQSGMQGHGQGQTRSWEEAEPNYQYGYATARDARYQGREFDDVEPDLRRDYETRFSGSGTAGSRTSDTSGTMSGGGGETWEHLRDEIREGWTRARGRS